MSGTSLVAEQLRMAIDEPLLAKGYLPTETIRAEGAKLFVEMRKDRREPSNTYTTKVVLIAEILSAYPGFVVESTNHPKPSTVVWVLRPQEPPKPTFP